jgi:hypothetical protein
MKKILFIILLSCAHFMMARHSSYPFISGDTFRAFCDHIYDETTYSLDVKKVKTGDTVFVKTDLFEQFFNYIHPHIRAQYILVSHNSDFPAPGRYTSYVDDPKIIVWFAQNVSMRHGKLIPIPIGIVPSDWPEGNIETFKSAMKHIIPLHKRRTDKLVYVNFRFYTNREVREPVWEFFAHQSFSYMATFKPHMEFLLELSDYRFAVSPPGAGEDCHRTWESLLMGTIPIVKHSPMDSVFEGLPVVLINDWKEITEEFLLEKYKEISSKTYNMEKIYAEYWLKLIRSYQRKYKTKKSYLKLINKR